MESRPDFTTQKTLTPVSLLVPDHHKIHQIKDFLKNKLGVAFVVDTPILAEYPATINADGFCLIAKNIKDLTALTTKIKENFGDRIGYKIDAKTSQLFIESFDLTLLNNLNNHGKEVTKPHDDSASIPSVVPLEQLLKEEEKSASTQDHEEQAREALLQFSQFDLEDRRKALYIVEEVSKILEKSRSATTTTPFDEPLMKLLDAAKKSVALHYEKAKRNFAKFEDEYGLKPQAGFDSNYTPTDSVEICTLLLTKNSIVEEVKADIKYMPRVKLNLYFIDALFQDYMSRLLSGENVVVEMIISRLEEEIKHRIPPSDLIGILCMTLKAQKLISEFPGFSPEKKSAIEGIINKEFIEELLPKVHYTLIRAINNSPAPIFEAGVVRKTLEAMASEIIPSVSPHILRLARRVATIEARPALEDLEFINKAKQAGFGFKPRSFLKDNSERIKAAIEEVFSGTDDTELKGKLVGFDYTENDCSDLRHWGSTLTPKNSGPGIRIAMKFNDGIVRRFYYPENTCKNIGDFLDNLNTDFGMTQIRSGNKTKSLGIITYNLNENLICFEIGYNTVVNENQLKRCWDVNTLTFNVNEFLLMKCKRQIISPTTSN